MRQQAHLDCTVLYWCASLGLSWGKLYMGSAKANAVAEQGLRMYDVSHVRCIVFICIILFVKYDSRYCSVAVVFVFRLT